MGSGLRDWGLVGDTAISYNILMLGAEAAPLIKIGGLGDVLGALPTALAARGHTVHVMLPHYGRIDDLAHAVNQCRTVSVPWGGTTLGARVACTERDGVFWHLIAGGPLQRDDRIYSTTIDVDGPRFGFFAMAAMRVAEAIGTPFDILHVHDFHPALSVYWLAQARQREAFWRNTASVLTVHNLPFQGNHAQEALAHAGLRPDTRSGLPKWAQAGFLPLALAHADMINAVSPGYAGEMLTEEYGAGLDDFLLTRKDRLAGILNGLDYEAWNPATDSTLPWRFEADRLDARKANKAVLQRRVGLPTDELPLFGVVSRLDHQKGFDLAVPALERLLHERKAQAVVLGTGMAEIQDGFAWLESELPQQVAFVNRYDGVLARQIYASCDIFLMPSRYEPCGIGQMIAMRYGAPPVVRATGGLKDTVIDYDADPANGTGFVFDGYSIDSFVDAMLRALDRYENGQDTWHGLQQRGMALRFSWGLAAERYETLFAQALAHAQGAGQVA